MQRRVELDVTLVKQNRLRTVKQSEYGTPCVALSDSITIQTFGLYSMIFYKKNYNLDLK